MNSLFGACHLNHPTQQSGLNDDDNKQAIIFLNKVVLLYLPLSESGCYNNIHAPGELCIRGSRSDARFMAPIIAV